MRDENNYSVAVEKLRSMNGCALSQSNNNPIAKIMQVSLDSVCCLFMLVVLILVLR